MSAAVNQGASLLPPTNSQTSSNSLYPYATSPDIIRSNQKDIFLTSHLRADVDDILRRLFGSRLSHLYSAEIEIVTSSLYFALTTLIGNRTLGEEYTDIFQVEDGPTALQRLPSIGRRSGYIIISILFPYAASRILPTLRGRVHHVLEARVAKRPNKPNLASRIQAYLLTNITSITSPAPVHALTLALFYFTGRYYHLSKRIFGLRYIFSRRLTKFEEQQRVGYEVLGLLLFIQIAAQVFRHVRDIVSETSTSGNGVGIPSEEQAAGQAGASDDVTALRSAMAVGNSQIRSALFSHTPLLQTGEARYDLEDTSKLAWLQPQQQRKCTLCLDFMKDPSVTTCGHVFCWTCILDWIKEKPECPLCRQRILSQHVLPLRG